MTPEQVVTVGRHALEVTRATVPVADLPPALDGLRVGLMTDIHRSSSVSSEDVARAVTALTAEHPDLVVASVLMSMGMMMLSPMLISLPFKIMLFVLVNGWSLLVGTLAASFFA